MNAFPDKLTCATVRGRRAMRRRIFVAGCSAFLLCAPPMSAQPEIRPARLDDTPPPAYVLPDPLVSADGSPVADAAAWKRRRAELLELFASEVYGRTPVVRSLAVRAEATSVDSTALGGLATRKQITLRLSGGGTAGGPAIHVLLYVPNATRPAAGRWPVWVGLNFYGNHTVSTDPGITLSEAWMPADAPHVVDHRATEASRGSDAGKWPIERILARGYAVATAYYGDLCPDRPDGLAAGVSEWLAPGTTTEKRAPEAWGAIGVWAWGLSRMADYLATDPDIDAARIAVIGHSRLGKTALWAAAQDERFALVVSNASGCGGAALSKRVHGETVAKINAQFPHWFARAFRRYDDREADLPLDQHELLALIAPRPLYVASAEDDDWADPRGEFLSVKAAEPVYRLFGLAGPSARDVPPVHAPDGGALRYHIRSGPHDLTAYDWERYLDFADEWLRPGSR
jgi:hypothetical protein